jgi:hypothetical protein
MNEHATGMRESHVIGYWEHQSGVTALQMIAWDDFRHRIYSLCPGYENNDN